MCLLDGRKLIFRPVDTMVRYPIRSVKQFVVDNRNKLWMLCLGRLYAPNG